MADTLVKSRSVRLARNLDTWIENTPPQKLADREHREAIEAIDTALAATIKYLNGSGRGGKSKPTPEDISKLWRKASVAVGPVNEELSAACGMKGFGWIKPGEWERARKKGVKIGIEEMQDALIVLTASRPSIARPGVPYWFPIAGVSFAAITVLFLMYWLLVGPQFDPQKKVVFDVLIALCVACSGAFLGGSAVASGKIPWFKNSPIQFSTAGGIAIFIIVLAFMEKIT